MTTIGELCDHLEKLYPLSIAEDWDNVGLLLGDRDSPVERVMTCLTITPKSADEAIREKANLVITHHPIFFRPVKRLTADSSNGFVYNLARNGVSIYSPHTAYDNAPMGINQQIANKLELTQVSSIRKKVEKGNAAKPNSTAVETDGAGRWGKLRQPSTLLQLSTLMKESVGASSVEYVGDPGRECSLVAIACGAASEFLTDAARLGCDVLITGEARFHDLLLAEGLGIGMLLAGHYATERFAMETMAEMLQKEFANLRIWPSRLECNPLRGFAE